jgi:hypothetical protein
MSGAPNCADAASSKPKAVVTLSEEKDFNRVIVDDFGAEIHRLSSSDNLG